MDKNKVIEAINTLKHYCRSQKECISCLMYDNCRGKWRKKMEEYKTNNKKWLELLGELSDIASFLDTKEMEENADIIRTAIDLLKYLNPECHATVSEFEWKRRMKNENHMQ